MAGTALSADERQLFQRQRPVGFILFARNCDHPDQIRALIAALRSAVEDPKAPVLIDQEGGRVTRLKPPHWSPLCAIRRIGELAERDINLATEAAWLHARLIAADLEPLGITVNCAPVLDLGFAGQTVAIGDRAFSADPANVGSLGRSMIEGYLAGGVLPVIKHMPGHGRALVDSHKTLPRVEASLEELSGADWLPFRACAHAPLGMTAHILYAALDRTAPATQSASIIGDIIRGKIGFKGALLSDDLSMEALGGSLGDRAAAARRAGCDLAVHCNGDLDEMTQVIEAAGRLEGEPLSRVNHAMARRRPPESFDVEAGRARLDQLLDTVQISAESVG